MSDTQHPARDTNEQFLDRLRDLAMDWHFSDEFIGKVVRTRWAKNRPGLVAVADDIIQECESGTIQTEDAM